LHLLDLKSEQALHEMRKNVGDEALISIAGDILSEQARANGGRFVVPAGSFEIGPTKKGSAQ
jgi:hypothetical protein